MVDTLDVKAAELAAKAALELVKPSEISMWEAFKKKVLQFFGGLIMEQNVDGTYVISVGRVAWWMAFLPAIAIWVSGEGSLNAGEALKDISPNHFNILVVLAGYNFGKKAIDVANNIWGKEQDGPG